MAPGATHFPNMAAQWFSTLDPTAQSFYPAPTSLSYNMEQYPYHPYDTFYSPQPGPTYRHVQHQYPSYGSYVYTQPMASPIQQQSVFRNNDHGYAQEQNAGYPGWVIANAYADWHELLRLQELRDTLERENRELLLLLPRSLRNSLHIRHQAEMIKLFSDLGMIG